MGTDVKIDYDDLGTIVETKLQHLLDELKKKVAVLEGHIEEHNIRYHFSPESRVLDVRRRPGKKNKKPLSVAGTHISQVEDSKYNDYRTTELPMDTKGCVKLKSPIVFLLESPHSDEYSQGTPLNPIAPAQGKTGRKINSFINLDVDFFKKYPLILCNPIQWQTSLAQFHGFTLDSRMGREIRNAVWQTVWMVSGVQEEFSNRLKKYHPAVVVNACTKGHKKPCPESDMPTSKDSSSRLLMCRYGSCKNKDICLRGMVQTLLNNPEYPLLVSHHPSSPKFNKEYKKLLFSNLKQLLVQ